MNDDDRMVDVHSPEVPTSIRDAVLVIMGPGDQLWRCPCLSPGRRGFFGIGAQPDRVVIEWWLSSADGELIEAFWLEP